MGGLLEKTIESSKVSTEQIVESGKGLIEQTVKGAKKLFSSKSKSKKISKSQKIEDKTSNEDSQFLRIHLSCGEIHFHDDKQKIKVEMPISDWWSAWNRLSCLNIKEYEYLDKERGTVLNVSLLIDEDDTLEAKVFISKIFNGPVKTGETFKKLDSYVNKGEK